MMHADMKLSWHVLNILQYYRNPATLKHIQPDAFFRGYMYYKDLLQFWHLLKPNKWLNASKQNMQIILKSTLPQMAPRSLPLHYA